jgi:hypothetical protein
MARKGNDVHDSKDKPGALIRAAQTAFASDLVLGLYTIASRRNAHEELKLPADHLCRIRIACNEDQPLCEPYPERPPKSNPPNPENSKADPNAELQKFAKMVEGTWTLKVTWFPTPENPKGRSDNGTSRIQYGPGKLALIEDYRTDGDTGSEVALGFFWWDAKAQGYRTMFCDDRDANVFGL